MDKGNIFIDGSHLFSRIYELWKLDAQFKDKKINISKLSQHLLNLWHQYTASIIRIVYYFKKNDPRMRSMLVIPDTSLPGNKDHWLLIGCAENLPSIPEEEKQKIPSKYWDQLGKSEKGLDMRLACDALVCISTGKASNAVFLINDRDYIPLLKAFHSLGGNTYLTGLHPATRPKEFNGFS